MLVLLAAENVGERGADGADEATLGWNSFLAAGILGLTALEDAAVAAVFEAVVGVESAAVERAVGAGVVGVGAAGADCLCRLSLS